MNEGNGTPCIPLEPKMITRSVVGLLYAKHCPERSFTPFRLLLGIDIAEMIRLSIS